jgi:hypothetical protein
LGQNAATILGLIGDTNKTPPTFPALANLAISHALEGRGLETVRVKNAEINGYF